MPLSLIDYETEVRFTLGASGPSSAKLQEEATVHGLSELALSVPLDLELLLGAQTEAEVWGIPAPASLVLNIRIFLI